MKLLIACFWISFVALGFGEPISIVISDDLQKADWLLISRDTKGHSIKAKLDRERINLLTKILNTHAVQSPTVSQKPAGPPPRPAPDLIIEICNKEGSILAQILGFNHDLIGFRAYSISDKDIVAKFYTATKQKKQ